MYSRFRRNEHQRSSAGCKAATGTQAARLQRRAFQRRQPMVASDRHSFFVLRTHAGEPPAFQSLGDTRTRVRNLRRIILNRSVHRNAS